MRIGLFAHSTNPRGGVVHALELAGALTKLGHDVTLVAPDITGAGLFRPTRARVLTVPAAPCADLASLVARRTQEIAGFFLDHLEERFDIWHANCSITANALADLAADGRIGGFVRTVHHLDRFDDPRLEHRQRVGVQRADRLYAVSDRTRADLQRRYGLHAALTGNGVDPHRFKPAPDGTDVGLRGRLGLSARDRPSPVYLTIGGIEARKNTVAILRAFLRIHAAAPCARLIVAGGASLLDHSAARAEFLGVLAGSGAAHAVILPGVIADTDMPALYRLADALVFVSRSEGFGLCPLEAMSCGTPAIVAAMPPFDEHFRPDECLWADPDDDGSIEIAMHAAVSIDTRSRLARSGPVTAARFSWHAVARRTLELYPARSPTHA